jgi:hypothetical protein
MTTSTFSFSNTGLVGCITIAYKTLISTLLMCLHGTNIEEMLEKKTYTFNAKLVLKSL